MGVRVVSKEARSQSPLTCLRGGGGGGHGATDDEVGGGREEEQAPEVGGERGMRAHKRGGADAGARERAEAEVGVGGAAGGAVVGPTGAAMPHTERFPTGAVRAATGSLTGGPGSFFSLDWVGWRQLLVVVSCRAV